MLLNDRGGSAVRHADRFAPTFDLRFYLRRVKRGRRNRLEIERFVGLRMIVAIGIDSNVLRISDRSNGVRGERLGAGYSPAGAWDEGDSIDEASVVSC